MIRVVKDSLSLPGFCCCLLLLLIGISFASQSLQLRSLLAVSAAPAEALDAPSTADLGHDAGALFGLENTSPRLPASQLKLSLLACFVQSEADRSIALIAVENQPPRRVRVGEEFAGGLRLQKVEARRVLLSQGGQSVTLGLQRSKAMAVDVALQASAGAAQ